MGVHSVRIAVLVALAALCAATPMTDTPVLSPYESALPGDCYKTAGQLQRDLHARTFTETTPVLPPTAADVAAGYTEADGFVNPPVSSTIVNKLAFGSCNKQNLPQAAWPSIAAQNPDAFVWMGDAAYLDKPIPVRRSVI